MISTINEAVAHVKANSISVKTYEPISQFEIAGCEKIIGYRLPESYKLFLQEFGFGSFGSVEFYGLRPGDFEQAFTWNALSQTQKSHDTGDLPTDMYIIENLDDGGYACLKLSEIREGKCPVVLWEYGIYVRDDDPEPYCVLADSFSSYFIHKIIQQVEWEQIDPEKWDGW